MDRGNSVGNDDAIGLMDRGNSVGNDDAIRSLKCSIMIGICNALAPLIKKMIVMVKIMMIKREGRK